MGMFNNPPVPTTFLHCSNTPQTTLSSFSSMISTFTTTSYILPFSYRTITSGGSVVPTTNLFPCSTLVSSP